MTDTPGTAAHVERPTKLADGKTYCSCGAPWPCPGDEGRYGRSFVLADRVVRDAALDALADWGSIDRRHVRDLMATAHNANAAGAQVGGPGTKPRTVPADRGQPLQGSPMTGAPPVPQPDTQPTEEAVDIPSDSVLLGRAYEEVQRLHQTIATLTTDRDAAVREARHRALTDAWQAVDKAVRPLGYGGGASNSPWNEGYTRARDDAQNAILWIGDPPELQAPEPYVPAPGDLFIDGKGNGWSRGSGEWAYQVGDHGPSVRLTDLPQPLRRAKIIEA